MKSPFVIYFAGVGTVVAALAVGFGGGLFLTGTSVVKETAASSATRVERLRTAKLDKTETQRDEASSAGLLAATAVVPVDVKAPAAVPAPQQQAAVASTAPVAPVAQAPVEQSTASAPPAATAVQGQASFEGPNNAIEISPSKKPIADASKKDRGQQTAQRRTRDVIVQAARDRDHREAVMERELAAQPAYGEVRIVRTYEARPRRFGGLFFADDEAN